MTDLIHKGRVIQTTGDDWQTVEIRPNSDAYEIYLALADNGAGIDITTGRPLKTYDEWLNS